MTRVARGNLFANCTYFHILTEGLSQLDIFGATNMKKFYLSTIEEKAKDMDISVLAYCIMDNHSHLVLTADNSLIIPEFMRRLNTVYAKFFNRIKGRTGYVFNGRYESDNLINNEQILDAIYFVHNNPIKAKLAVNSSEYEFSSAKDYLNNQSFIDYDKLKHIFNKIPELTSCSLTKSKFKEAKPSENCDTVLLDLIKRYNITDKKALQDPELLKTVIYELQSRSGVSLRDVAFLLDLDREKIRRIAKKINYDI